MRTTRTKGRRVGKYLFQREDIFVLSLISTPLPRALAPRRFRHCYWRMRQARAQNGKQLLNNPRAAALPNPPLPFFNAAMLEIGATSIGGALEGEPLGTAMGLHRAEPPRTAK